MTQNKKSVYKIILFNGAPRSGKDTGVNFLTEKYDQFTHLKLANVLKTRTHALYGMDLPADHFEPVKDIPRKEFMGITPREAYINVAEKLFKDVHGDEVFAKMMIEDIRNQHSEYIAISDLGFDVEIEKFIEEFGAKNVILVKVHREGCTFANDSRNFVETVDENGHAKFPGLHTLTIVNDDLDIYLEQLEMQIFAMLKYNKAV